MSIKPDRHPFFVYRGATFRKLLTFHLTDKASPPRDLTGYTARLTVKANNLTVASLTTENGGITLGGAAGTIALYMSAADTLAASWELGTYALYLISPSGDTNILLHGNFSIKGL